jgi:uncharacterized membrane protein
MESEKAFSSGEALRFGWDTTLRNAKPLLLIGVAGAFLALVQRALSASPRAGLLSLAVQVLQVGVTLAYLHAALRLNDGQPVELDRPSALLEGFWPFLLTSVLVGLIVAGGLILLVVPGVIWALRYGFAGIIVADGERDPLEALRRSRHLTGGIKGQLLGFWLLVLGVNLLGAMALGIGLLVTLPTTMLAAVYVFRRLQARAGRPLPHPGLEEAPAR